MVAFILPIVFLACPLLGSDVDVSKSGAVPVTVKQTDNGWKLFRDGKPYYIHGAGGDGPLDLLADCHGNSTRIWGANSLTADRLDEAHAHGITVAVGIWLEHENRGFDYQDFEQVNHQIEKSLAVVEKFKDHPAVLLWGIGNEMEGYEKGDNPAIWHHVEFLSQRIKQIDPNHPTMTVVAEIGGNRIRAIHQFCPSIDIIGINAYGGAPSIPTRYRDSGATKPYIVTEFGPAGVWEVGRNEFGAIEEPTSNQKAQHVFAAIKNFRRDQKFCLGSYAFLWGQKMEGTATWFGMLLDDNRLTATVDAVAEIWNDAPVSNRCPVIEELLAVGSRTVEPGTELNIKIEAMDPEGQPLQVEWIVRPEADAYITAGDFRKTPPEMTDSIITCDSSSAVIKAPVEGGIYRVYAVVDDGTGRTSVGSLPFRVNRSDDKRPGAPVEIPVIALDDYDNEDLFSLMVPSDTHPQISMDRDSAKFGAVCIKCFVKSGENSVGAKWQTVKSVYADDEGASYDLSKAKRMIIWAKGAKGSEIVRFGIGSDDENQDSLHKHKEIQLSPYWKKYYLEFANTDRRRVSTGFYWSAKSTKEAPLEFYVDRVEFD